MSDRRFQQIENEALAHTKVASAFIPSYVNALVNKYGESVARIFVSTRLKSESFETEEEREFLEGKLEEFKANERERREMS